MEEIKISMVIQSHLSDAMAIMGSNPEEAMIKIAFVKSLVSIYKDTSVYESEDTIDSIYNKTVEKYKKD